MKRPDATVAVVLALLAGVLVPLAIIGWQIAEGILRWAKW